MRIYRIFEIFCFFNFKLLNLVGYKDVVALLVENKADVSARNKLNETPCDYVPEKSKIQNESSFKS